MDELKFKIDWEQLVTEQVVEDFKKQITALKKEIEALKKEIEDLKEECKLRKETSELKDEEVFCGQELTNLQRGVNE